MIIKSKVLLVKKIVRQKFSSLLTRLEQIDNLLNADRRRKKINNTDFTIISNNCWGAHVYRRYGLPYNSPTIGLYFFAEEYIKFLSDLKNNIDGEIRFITPSQSKYRDFLFSIGQQNVIIGVINDSIEVVFLHYKTQEEALTKWRRRAARVNYDNLIVKFSEMNLCTETLVNEFIGLNFDRKILLSAHTRPGVDYCFRVKRYCKGDNVADDTTYYASFFNITKYINGY